MKWSVFVRTLNPWLTAIFVVCVVVVFSMDMWLMDIEAPYKLFVAIGKFNYGVAVSYIAAYIFYLITVHYPETKSMIAIYTAASNPAKAIVSNVEYIFLDMAKKLGMDLTKEDLNDEVISDILAKTKCFSASTMSHKDLSPMDWLEYLLNKEAVIKSFYSKLSPLYPKMDSEYISALSAVEQEDIIKPTIGMITVSIGFGHFKKEDITFTNGIEEMFLSYYHKAKNLDSIIQDRNSTYDVSIVLDN